MSAPTLRKYQTDTLDAICAEVGKGNNRLLIQSATGTGKTTVFSSLLSWPQYQQWAQGFGGSSRTLIIAHREELIQQAAERIHRLNPSLLISIEQGEQRASYFSDVTVASIQSLAAMKFRRLQRLLSRGPFRLVICDECHHAASPTYRTAFTHLGFLPKADATDKEGIEAADFDDVKVMEEALRGWDATAPKDRLLVGFTATPNRSDAIGLGCVFQSLTFSYPIKRATEDGWLVPIVPYVVETDTSLDEVRVTAGEFNQKDLAQAVNNPKRNAMALAAWLEHAKGRPTIAFTVDVQHAHDLAEIFMKGGVEARAVSGETPKDERRQMFKDFSARRFDVLTNCQVATEGVDLPLTACVLMAKPTKSATLLEQCIGRGLRPLPVDGKTDCVVLDLVDVSRRHSLQTAPILYGLPPGLKTDGRSLKEMEQALDAFREQYPHANLDEWFKNGPMTLAQLQARASTFDIWKVPELGTFGHGRTLDWTRCDDEYRLSYPWADGHETIAIQKNLLGQWEISLTLRPDSSMTPYAAKVAPRQRTLATQLPSPEAAAVIAEQFIAQERREATRLLDNNALWKKRPASEKQIAYLQRLRVPVKPHLTMGEAGALINLAKHRRAR